MHAEKDYWHNHLHRDRLEVAETEELALAGVPRGDVVDVVGGA